MFSSISVIKKFFFILNVLVAGALLVSYLAPFISPSSFYPVAFFGLAYPFLFIVNCLFVLGWLMLWKKHVFLSLLAISLGWNHIGKFVQLNKSGGDSVNEGGFKIMSYNVRLFDLYNWTGNLKTRNKIFDLIKEEDAGILCLQEFFYSGKKNYFNTLDTLLQLQGAKYFHVDDTKVIGTHHFGIATFSKYPIVAKGVVELANMGNNLCIFSDIKINEDTIRVYNAHLASLHFAENDYRFLEEIAMVETGEKVKGIGHIFSRIKDAFIRRSYQADAIADHISQSPFAVIFCGDFNDVPLSYAYSAISGGMNDAFRESGSGMGATYIGKLSPFRIDYILHSSLLVSAGFETIPENLSDHYPISCNIHFNREKKE